MVRDALDRYYTPYYVAEKCVAALPSSFSGHALEPHSGQGAFVAAMSNAKLFTRITWTDIERGHDFLQYAGSPDCIIGNPPYRDAEAHVRHALSLTPKVAFLLRLGFLASQKRAALFEQHRPAMVCVLSKRPSFTGGGTDNSDYAFVIWNGRRRVTKVDWI